jgi:voltage-gated sodium channel
MQYPTETYSSHQQGLGHASSPGEDSVQTESSITKIESRKWFGSSLSAHRSKKPPVRKLQLGKLQICLHGERDVEDAGHWLVVHARSIILSTNFELFMGTVIILNMLSMAIHLQWKGLETGHVLGLRQSSTNWSRAQSFFKAEEKIFNVVYLCELLGRIWAFRSRFFKSAFNFVDGLIVLCTCFVSFVLEPLETTGLLNFSSLRVMRVFRVLRLLKVVRFAEYMGEIRVLVRTLLVSMRGLEWSVVLIGSIILAGAILVTQLALVFLEDESVAIVHRQWLYQMFGSTTRSAYTIFECTFTGGWRIYSRRTIEDISLVFVAYWIPFVVCINFACMRVIGALFLKQTLAVAQVDQERMAMESMREREQFAKELHEVFFEADEKGDGTINQEEFEKMLRNPHIIAHFEKIDLEQDEVIALFGVLSADDGEADYEEFLEGAMKMKSSARTIDSIQIMHHQLQMNRSLDQLKKRLGVGIPSNAHTKTGHAHAQGAHNPPVSCPTVGSIGLSVETAETVAG